MDRRQLLKQLPLVLAGAGSLPALYSLAQRVSAGTWSPSSAEEKDIEALAEAIIPETNTPGAIAAGVPAFILLALNDLISPAARKEFLQGLSNFGDDCKVKFGTSFSDLNPEQQHTILDTYFVKRDSFIMEMKRWVLTGYFTSEIGITENLFYHPIPGKFDHCIDVNQQSRANASYF